MPPFRIAAVTLPLLTILFGPAVAHAAGEPNIIVVTTTEDKVDAFDQRCSLREAVMNANMNAQLSPVIGECPAGSGSGTDVIVLESGATYLLTREGESNDAGDLDLDDDPELSDGLVDIRIQTTSSAPATLRQSVAGQRVIEVFLANAELSNLAILGGDATNGTGGGILSNSESLLLDRVTISANKAYQGGGLAVDGNATLIDSHVAFNEASLGGGVYHTGGHLQVRGGSIQQNNGKWGGGIHSPGTLTVEMGALLSENVATQQGGSIFFSTTDKTIVLRDIKIENNTALHGGALHLASETNAPTATIERVEFYNNHASARGGAILSKMNLKIVDSKFLENSAGSGGGAIATEPLAHSPTVDVENTLFSQNSGMGGGAIYADETTLKARKTVFSENIATLSGGAVLFSHLSNLPQYVQVQDSQFIKNAAPTGGGLALVSAGAINANSILGSSFIENSADTGGAISAQIDDITIANTTISGNSSSQSGSAIAIPAGSSVTVTNATLARNGPGAAIHKSGNLTLKNSILFSPDAANCAVSPQNPLLLSLGNNLVDDLSCLGVNHPSDQTGPGVDPKLAPLADNGGNTQTHALLDGSPAIDAGDGVACANAPVNGVDQRGFARSAGLNCDIGAYEKAATPIEQPVELFKDGFE